LPSKFLGKIKKINLYLKKKKVKILLHKSNFTHFKGFTFFMKNNNTTEARKSPPKVSFESSDVNLTSQAGLIPVIHFLDSLSLLPHTKNLIPNNRGSNAIYQLADIVQIAIVAFVAGATSLSGMITVWGDTILQRLAGWMKIPHESHFGRLWKEFQWPSVNALESLNHLMRKQAWGKVMQQGMTYFWHLSWMWIDVDSSVVPLYGHQEGAEKGYNPEHKGQLSYHPLLAFCAHTKEILQGWLRCGSAYTSNGTIDFLRQLFAQMPKTIRYIVRGDSGFFDGDLLSYLEGKGFGYLIKVKLKNLVNLLSAQTWKPISGKPGWDECEFFYACHGWDKNRRFLGVRQELETKPSPQKKLLEEKEYAWFCYVTTEDLSPMKCHKTYGERATCETWIDEAKNQMGLGSVRTADFWANSALFQCAILAYNTIKWMGICSQNDFLQKWEIKTVRTFIIRLAGKLVKSGGQFTLKMPANEFYAREKDAWFKISPG
jgi:hypothetical protein